MNTHLGYILETLINYFLDIYQNISFSINFNHHFFRHILFFIVLLIMYRNQDIKNQPQIMRLILKGYLYFFIAFSKEFLILTFRLSGFVIFT